MTHDRPMRAWLLTVLLWALPIAGMSLAEPTTSVGAAMEVLGQEVDASATVSTPVTPPTAPQHLSAAVRKADIILAWDAPAWTGGETISYRVYDASSGILLATTPETTWTHHAGYGVTRAYKVAARNSAGEGPASEVCTAQTPGAPPAPYGLRAFSGDQRIVLQWTSGDGGYATWRIYRDGALRAQTQGDAAFVDTNLSNGEPHAYRVTAVNDRGESLPSNEVMTAAHSSSTEPSPPREPSAPRSLFGARGVGSVTLSWQTPAQSGASPVLGYDVYRDDQGAPRARVPGDQLSYKDTGLAEGEQHTYHVVAVNSDGESPPSASVTVAAKTRPSPPSNVSARRILPGGAAEVSWSPSDNGGSRIVSYHLYRMEPGSSPRLIADVGGSFARDEGCSVLDDCAYAVTAVNVALGEGGFSETVTLHP